VHYLELAIILIYLISSRQVYRVSDSLSKDIPNANPPPTERGRLFVVATPIGNLGDISHRAIQVLGSVNCILAEDTRHSKRLLNHYGISSKLRACHEHNEESQIEWVTTQLTAGEDLALISDAGTPLISDPGFVLVRALRCAGFEVIAIPGASSIIAALSIAGLPTNGFVYDGFLPAKRSARQTALAEYLNQRRTVVLLESSHRILACLEDVVEVLGAERSVALARELTKRFETVLVGSAQEILAQLQTDDDQTRGEFVLMLSGVEPVSDSYAQAEHMLKTLIADLPVKKATNLVAKMTGLRKNELYELALQIKSELDV